MIKESSGITDLFLSLGPMYFCSKADGRSLFNWNLYLIFRPGSKECCFWRKLPLLWRRPSLIRQTWNFTNSPRQVLWPQSLYLIVGCHQSSAAPRTQNTASKAETFFGAALPKSWWLASKQCLAVWLTTAHRWAAGVTQLWERTGRLPAPPASVGRDGGQEVLHTTLASGLATAR